jgi:hypothetical protein
LTTAVVTGHRHGSRVRTLTGTFGKTEIAVPRARLNTSGGKTTEWKSQVLRRTRAADALIAGAYLSGTNTRRVRRALRSVFGEPRPVSPIGPGAPAVWRVRRLRRPDPGCRAGAFRRRRIHSIRTTRARATISARAPRDHQMASARTILDRAIFRARTTSVRRMASGRIA